jgi:hypothetical protein
MHHGCGHDGHTAMLLGAAQHLARAGGFDGSIAFIFQPAEEGRKPGHREGGVQRPRLQAQAPDRHHQFHQLGQAGRSGCLLLRGLFQATSGPGERVSFAVPAGNFGNICAGHVARMMGLPIDKLVLATHPAHLGSVLRHRVRAATTPEIF